MWLLPKNNLIDKYVLIVKLWINLGPFVSTSLYLTYNASIQNLNVVVEYLYLVVIIT